MRDTIKPAVRVNMLERETRVLELRRQNLPFSEIAKELGIAKSTAHRDYERFVARTVLAPSADERDRQIGIVNALLDAWLPRALAADNPQAARMVDRQLIRLAALTGTNTPINHRLIVTDSMTAEIEQLAAEMGVNTGKSEQLAIGA